MMKTVIRVLALAGFFSVSQGYVVDSLLFGDDFDGALENWVCETVIGGSVNIVSGVVDIDDNGGTAVWYKYPLSDSIAIEYSARCLSDGANLTDLNCFWMARDRESTPVLSLDSASFFNAGRTGLWATYHSLEAYYFGYGANLNTTFNLRRYYDPNALPTEVLSMPRDGHRVIIASDNQTGLITAGTWYRFKVVYFKGLIEVWVNNVKQFTYTEQSYDVPYNRGYFGFRTTYSVHAQFDSVRIFLLKTSSASIDDHGMRNTKEQGIKCSPNPFNPMTKITIPNLILQNTNEEFKIFDIRGKLVKDPTPEIRSPRVAAGEAGNSITWDASALPSGAYIIKAQAGANVLTKKVILAR